MKNLNFLQKSGMLQTVKQQKVNTSKAILFNLKQKALNTDVAFKNCAPFSTCKTEIKDVFLDEANHICVAMPMYNLIEYSDKYSDTTGSLWQFKEMMFL